MKINVQRRTNSDRQNFFNGTFKESFDAVVTATTGPDEVTLTLTNAVSGNLTMQFSDGLSILDLSGNGTIVLTEGTFNTPKTNWIYIPIDTKVLTVSETGYPTNIEHIPITFVLLPNAAEIILDGTWINQNWNDHLMDILSQGHLSHIGATIRLGTGYHSGIEPNGLDQDTLTSYFNIDGAAVRFKASSGISRQMHEHVHPAVDTGASDDIHIINWSGDSFHSLTDLKDIQADSTGGSLSNRYFNVFFFEVANKTGTYAPIMAQLPNGSYVSATSARNDVDGFDNNSMPREFILDSTVGIPICRMTMRWSGGFTTLTHISTTDLRTRGLVAAGGAIGGGTVFADNQWEIFDEADITKKLHFDVGTLVGTGNISTIQIPDLSGIMALMGVTQSTNFTTTGNLSGTLLGASTAVISPIVYGSTLTGQTLTLHNNAVDMAGLVIGTDINAGALDFTTTGTVTAEQITSTDDIVMLGHALLLGDGSATDIAIFFNASANDGLLSWDESENLFDFVLGGVCVSNGDLIVGTSGSVPADINLRGGSSQSTVILTGLTSNVMQLKTTTGSIVKTLQLISTNVGKRFDFEMEEGNFEMKLGSQTTFQDNDVEYAIKATIDLDNTSNTPLERSAIIGLTTGLDNIIIGGYVMNGLKGIADTDNTNGLNGVLGEATGIDIDGVLPTNAGVRGRASGGGFNYGVVSEGDMLVDGGDLSLSTGKKINFEGPSGNSYFIYANGGIELWVDGIKEAEWGK